MGLFRPGLFAGPISSGPISTGPISPASKDTEQQRQIIRPQHAIQFVTQQKGSSSEVLIQNTVKNATEEMDKIVEEAISPGANPKNQYNI